jgi:hypothetical protein
MEIKFILEKFREIGKTVIKNRKFSIFNILYKVIL